MSQPKPAGLPPATLALIGVNVLVFVIMVAAGVNAFEPGGSDLLRWGANNRYHTLNGDWWRLITCNFLHYGVFHLLLNMSALLFIGMFLEPFLGKIRLISAYLLTGVFTALASIWWHENAASAGASGSIFGLYGVYIALLTTNAFPLADKRSMLISVGLFVAFNLFFGATGTIDNAGHAGGLLSGLLLGYIYYRAMKSTTHNGRVNRVLLYLFFGTAAIVILVMRLTQNDLGIYYKRIKQFNERQSRALDVLSQFNNYPHGKQRSDLEAAGLKCWNDNMDLVHSLNDLHLPENLQDWDRKLQYYCELRIKEATMIYKELDDGDSSRTDSISECQQQIRALSAELSLRP
jgi:rhomboid protease GluP